MTLARLCDFCGSTLTKHYYQLDLQRKEASQLAQEYHEATGDFCRDCLTKHAKHVVRDVLKDLPAPAKGRERLEGEP